MAHSQYMTDIYCLLNFWLRIKILIFGFQINAREKKEGTRLKLYAEMAIRHHGAPVTFSTDSVTRYGVVTDFMATLYFSRI